MTRSGAGRAWVQSRAAMMQNSKSVPTKSPSTHVLETRQSPSILLAGSVLGHATAGAVDEWDDRFAYLVWWLDAGWCIEPYMNIRPRKIYRQGRWHHLQDDGLVRDLYTGTAALAVWLGSAVIETHISLCRSSEWVVILESLMLILPITRSGYSYSNSCISGPLIYYSRLSRYQATALPQYIR